MRTRHRATLFESTSHAGGALSVAGQRRPEHFGTVRQMNLASSRAGNVRALGSLALITGLLISVISLLPDTGSTNPHILAGLFVATGIGLRLEAAIREPRPLVGR